MALPTTLRRLARAYGVQTVYEDVRGRRHTADRDALVAVLRALGAALDSPEDAADALRARRRSVWRRAVEPVTVAWDGEPASVVVRGPERATGRTTCRLRLEGGGVRTWSCQAAELEVVDTVELDGTRRVARRVPLPDGLPHGYHRLRVGGGDADAGRESLVIRAPRRAWRGPGGGTEREWGVFVPLYALRSKRSWGAGDLTDLASLGGWLEERGCSVVATLPLLAAFLQEPFEPSPYMPVSRLFWNELYLDPARDPGLVRCPSAQMLMNSTAFGEALERQREGGWVDYRAAAALKRQVLELLAESFFAEGTRPRHGFEAFLDARPRAREYARFRATVERLGRTWDDWPDRLRAGDLRPGDYDPEAERYHLYVQWLAHEQLEDAARAARIGVRPGLHLDLPLGVHPHGFDTWSERDRFARGASAGAPPDPFFSEGQDWGFPPLIPEAARADGYAYTIAAVRNHLRYASALRVDHVMSLHRLFWVPEGFDAKRGVYVRSRPEELYAILCLESHRHRARIVGEDLGTVPREVRRAMARRHVYRTRAVEFEASADEEPVLARPTRHSVAMLNTHDMPTFAAFWDGRDIEDRRELGWLDARAARREASQRARIREALARFLHRESWLDAPEATAGAALRACLEWLAAGPARIVLVNLEDLWLEPRPQNTPGTSAERPNWRRRTRYDIEALRELPGVSDTLERIDRLRRGGSDA